MSFDRVITFLKTNITDCGIVHEMGNIALMPGQFLWGGKQVYLLDTGEITSNQILSLRERNWHSADTWVKTVLAVLLVVPGIIVGVICKQMACFFSNELRNKYINISITLLPESSEKIRLYAKINYFAHITSILNNEKEFKAIVDSSLPLVSWYFLSWLKQDKILEWQLEERAKEIIESLPIEELTKTFHSISNLTKTFHSHYSRHHYEMLHQYLPLNSMQTLANNDHWKAPLLCTLPNDEIKINHFLSYLTTGEFNRVFKKLGHYVGDNSFVNWKKALKHFHMNFSDLISYDEIPSFSFPEYLIPYFIEGMKKENREELGPAFESLATIILPRIPSFTELLFKENQLWKIAYLLKPLQIFLLSLIVENFKMLNLIQDYESFFSIKTFVEWHQHFIDWRRFQDLFALNEENIALRDQIEYFKFSDKSWNEVILRKYFKPIPEMSIAQNLIIKRKLRPIVKIMISYFNFLNSLFMYDLTHGCYVLNHFLEREERELVINEFSELSQNESLFMSLKNRCLREVSRINNLPNNALPEELKQELEILDTSKPFKIA